MNDIVLSPMSGKIIDLEEVDDEIFSCKLMGDGLAIEPSEGVLCSPVNGKVTWISKTKHSIKIESDLGREILIHIGIDTVSLEGLGFNALVNAGDVVKSGEKLILFDLNCLEENNILKTTPIIFTDLKEDEFIFFKNGREVNIGDKLLEIHKK